MAITSSQRLTLVAFTTLASNLIPLMGLMFFGWSSFSVLLLYWLEGIFIIFKGKAHFFLVARIGRGSKTKNLIIKVLLSFISLGFVIFVLLLQSWLIFVSVKQIYAPNYILPLPTDLWGNIKIFFYLLGNIVPAHLAKENTLLIGIIFCVLNYVVMFFYLNLVVFQISIVARYWRSIMSVFILAILNWWMIGDIQSHVAPEWTYDITMTFIVLKLIFEVFPYLKRRKLTFSK